MQSLVFINISVCHLAIQFMTILNIIFSLERDYAIMMVNAKSLFPSKKLWFFVTYTGTIKYLHLTADRRC